MNRELLKTSLRLFLDFPSLFLAERRGFIAVLHAIFSNPFLQTSYPLGFYRCPIGNNMSVMHASRQASRYNDGNKKQNR
jgi:hypothetical protein